MNVNYALSNRQYQKGVTSLFVVIFAAILLSIITLSFAYLMNREVQRSSDDELSQSAYDSAMAGVEDAKRVVALAQTDSNIMNIIESGECDTIAQAGVAGSPGDSETIIQSTDTGVGSVMNQAYTCVTINMNSPDYRSSTDEMKSAIVPLRGDDTIHKVRIEWHKTDVGSLESACGADITDMPLCSDNSWGNPSAVPALLRAQFITPSNSFNLGELDTNNRGGTVFLYPKEVGASAISMNSVERYVNYTDTDSGPMNQTDNIICVDAVVVEGYRCSVTIALRSAQRIPANSPNALLRLTPYYNATDFRITLLDSSDRPIDFVGVQPVVDSTGRANDLFRRVEARLALTADQAYPEFALDVNGNLCKDFYVSQDGADQLSTTSCAP